MLLCVVVSARCGLNVEMLHEEVAEHEASDALALPRHGDDIQDFQEVDSKAHSNPGAYAAERQTRRSPGMNRHTEASETRP